MTGAVSEAEIARAVVGELQRQGFQTFEEVTGGRGLQRADVVGLRGALTVVVETKRAMSLAFLDQLCGWSGRAHWIVGAYERGRDGEAVRRLCKAEGFGLWTVGMFERAPFELLAPRLNRSAADGSIRKGCVPETATGSDYASAGTNGGGHYTPFRKTAAVLAAAVKAEPGITLKDAMDRIAHHYASAKSARSSMPDCIRRGLVPGVRIELDGRRITLYPTTEDRKR